MDRPERRLEEAVQVGALQDLRGDGPGMTDPITCPECLGAKGERLGSLFLACRFCGGLGLVGGAHEPAEESPAPPEGPPPPWLHPAVAASGLCPRCLGACKLVGLGGGDQRATQIVEVDCPDCAGRPI